MTRETEMDELTQEISAVLDRARRLNLDLCAYILAMALMAAVENTDGNRESPVPRPS